MGRGFDLNVRLTAIALGACQPPPPVSPAAAESPGAIGPSDISSPVAPDSSAAASIPSTSTTETSTAGAPAVSTLGDGADVPPAQLLRISRVSQATRAERDTFL